MLKITPVPALQDNYLYLLEEPQSGLFGVVDPSTAKETETALGKKTLSTIFCTHHHHDHVGGNPDLKKRYLCRILGSRYDKDRIPGLDETVTEGRDYTFGKEPYQVLEIPGHTLGHIAYYFPKAEALFCGDTLFASGCGRLFEGTPEEMWASLNKLFALPPSTKVYCGHEYTQKNLEFSAHLHPENKLIVERLNEVKAKRSRGEITIPTTLKEEGETNPFLPPLITAAKKVFQIFGASDAEIFAEVRRRKDQF